MSIRAIIPPRYKFGKNRKKRAKTFSSEESAKKWAEAQGIKKYSLVNSKSPESSTKKFRVVVEE